LSGHLRLYIQGFMSWLMHLAVNRELG